MTEPHVQIFTARKKYFIPWFAPMWNLLCFLVRYTQLVYTMEICRMYDWSNFRVWDIGWMITFVLSLYQHVIHLAYCQYWNDWRTWTCSVGRQLQALSVLKMDLYMKIILELMSLMSFPHNFASIIFSTRYNYFEKRSAKISNDFDHDYFRDQTCEKFQTRFCHNWYLH